MPTAHRPLGIDLSQVPPRVDARLVAVGEGDAQSVVADEFGGERAKRAGPRRRFQHGERVGLDLFALLARVGGGREPPQMRDGVEGQAFLNGEDSLYVIWTFYSH